MAEATSIVALPGIAALPPATAKQIGSGQVLVDPSSVVKELIDNALDARAKSIFVDITADTIDSIQVKDDGHGIPAEDRSLVCRRYCTSKIRDFNDLRGIGGKWLGFRGEALSSMAEMGGTFSVTTRVEGEPVAVRLKYGRNGELASIEHDSHPVGTTVKLTKFFKYMPVRKQAAIRNPSKCLAKIRRLMQTYALARPTIRFRLRVLKAKNSNGDFVYAPKPDANVEDALLKILGKDCALQCDWTVLEADGFEIHAFLPKPLANGPKISNLGAFISIDARPVSSSRATIKKMVTTFKNRLRKSNLSLASVKNPFLCMNIICPPDSYDPNVEPAKDDVMFDNDGVVLDVVDKLLKAYYPEAVVDIDDIESLVSAQPSDERQLQEPCARDQFGFPSHMNYSTDQNEVPISEASQGQPRWRSSMYGIDEDDLEFLQDDPAPVIEEETGIHAAEVSNPWTIARMNTAIRTKQTVTNVQLPSPAKSRGDVHPLPSPPRVVATPDRIISAEPLTPQTLPKTNMMRTPLEDESERSIQHLLLQSSEASTIDDWTGEGRTDRSREDLSRAQSETCIMGLDVQLDTRPPPMRPSQSGQRRKMTPGALRLSKRAHDRIPKNKSGYINKLFAPPTRESNETWFGQPDRDTQPSKWSHRQKRTHNLEVPLLSTNTPSGSRGSVPKASEKMTECCLYPENNLDIRSFFGQSREPQRDGVREETLLTPITLQAPPSQPRLTNSSFSSNRNRSIPGNQQDDSQTLSAEPHGVKGQFSAYAERERPPRPSSAGSQISMLFDQMPAHVRDALSSYSETGTTPDSRNMARLLQTYKTNSIASPAPQSSSTGSQNTSLIPQRTKQLTIALGTYRNDRPTRSAKDMNAYFVAHEKGNSTFSPSSTSDHFHLNQHPHTGSPPEKPSIQPHARLRRSTTDNLEGTKSSRLLLERSPTRFRVQNLVCNVATRMHDIALCMRKLDMSANTPAWGYAAEDAYGSLFADRVSESRSMQWVVRMDAGLCGRLDRVLGVDVRGVLHESVERVLDERQRGHVGSDIDGFIGLGKEEQQGTEGKAGNTRGDVVEKESEGGHDEDDIEDDMLMDR